VYRYSVLLVPDDVDDGYTVLVPALPGVVTQGETIDDALARAREAIALHLEGLALDGEPIPQERESPILKSVVVAPDLPHETTVSTVHDHLLRSLEL
jgi:antitoxin HicB